MMCTEKSFSNATVFDFTVNIYLFETQQETMAWIK